MTSADRLHPSEMSLVEAFRHLGPEEGDPKIDAARGAAAERILGELTTLRTKFDRTWNEEDVSDAIGVTLSKLTQMGPRGSRAGDPDTDGEVRGVLSVALKNNLIDGERREAVRRRAAEEKKVIDPEPPPPDPERLIMFHQALGLLFEEIVPAAAARRRGKDAQAGFSKTIKQLWRIATGETTFQAVVRSELEQRTSSRGNNPSNEEKRPTPEEIDDQIDRVKNTLQQRYLRAIEALEGEIKRRSQSGEVTDDHRQLIERIVNQLRLRPKKAE